MPVKKKLLILNLNIIDILIKIYKIRQIQHRKQRFCSFSFLVFINFLLHKKIKLTRKIYRR